MALMTCAIVRKDVSYGRDGGEWLAKKTDLVPVQKCPNCPISALQELFYPRNISHMPVVKLYLHLDLDQIRLFMDGHDLIDHPGV